MVRDLEAIVIASLVEVTGVELDVLAEDTPIDSLGLDSIRVHDLLMAVEDRLGCELPTAAAQPLAHVETLGDVIAALAGALSDHPNENDRELT
jgi:acyl carrier protein